MALLKVIARGGPDLPSWPGRGMLAAFAWLLCCGLTAPAQAEPSREYEVKAVFLFNFAQFVEWPPGVFPDAGAPLVIGVLGDDPFGPFLDETVRDEKVNGRPLAIRRFRHLEEIDRCQILFVNLTEAAGLEKVFDALRDRNVLTVGESDRFATRGGMIRFMTEKNKIRLRINLESVTAGGLKISSKLLRPAEIVGNKGN